MNNIIDFSHELLKDINNKKYAVDMTVGNGFDTLFLCEHYEFVYGFDIQQVAIDNTKKKLEENKLNNYKLILDSHSQIDKYINNGLDAIIYNLGYLPKGDKQITTKYEDVLISLNKVLPLLNKGGRIVIIFYPGHESGKKEIENIIPFLNNLDQKEFEVIKYEFINQINEPPFLIAIERR